MANKKLKFDIHIHLAGTGCCASGCWMHPRLRKRYTIKILQMMQKLSNKELDTDFDEQWVTRIAELVRSSQVDYGVVLGFDGVANSRGERDEDLSQLVIPPSWVFDICRRHDNLLPGPSINPHYKDSLEALEYCIENKAVLIKWLPSAQLIDMSSDSLKAFYTKLSKSSIPLLIHCGGEKTFFSLDPKLNSVSLLRAPLDAGVKVICAHSGTRVLGSSEKDEIPLLKNLLNEYPNLWLDNSGLCNPSRFSHLPKLARDELINSRTLYGSDWPVSSNAFYYLKEMGLRKVISFEREKNWISRDIGIKKFFGYSEKSLERASEVLANLDFWC